MKRVSVEEVITPYPVYSALEKIMLQEGIEAAVLWDRQSIIDAYKFHEVTISDRSATEWFDQFGDELQMVASHAARRFVLDNIAAELKQASEEGFNAKV